MGNQLKQTVSETVLATTADLSGVVHTTGTESISGIKTFTNNLFVGDGSSNNVIIANNAIKQMVNGTTKTYNFPSTGGTLELQGHTHNELDAYYTKLLVVDDGTGGLITRENVEKGFKLGPISVTDPSNNSLHLEITIGIPIKISQFSNDDSLYSTSSIWLQIRDVDNSVDIVSWQEAAIDHAKDNAGKNFFLSSGITINPYYSFPQYDWSEYLQTAPFTITKNNDNTFYFTESWGPISTYQNNLQSETWTANTAEQIETVNNVNNKLAAYAKSDHTHTNIKWDTIETTAYLNSISDNAGMGTIDVYGINLESSAGKPAMTIGYASSACNLCISLRTDDGISLIRKNLSDRRIYKYDGIHDVAYGTYGHDFALQFPTITKNETIATLSDIPTIHEGVVSTTYSNLVTLRSNNQLVPGTTYRITDYETTTSTTNTQSAGHAFDLLVVADDVNKLNENARATLHSGDTYFANCKLEAWKIKYCLENNTSKFEWASSSGKGVIYEMEDEWGNKCAYDFKNIQFKRYAITSLTSTIMEGNGLTSLQSSLVYNSSSPYVAMAVDAVVPSIYGCTATIDANTFQWKYTFNDTGSAASDASLDGGARCNYIGARTVSKVFKLNNITLLGSCYSNKFGEDCYNISTRSSVTRANFGNSCHDMLLGGFGLGSFGNFCSNIAIGGSALVASRYTRIGDACSDISSGMRIWNCTFGQSCSKITLGTYTHKCTFGSGCSYIHFGSSTGSKSYYQHITIKPGNQYIYLNCTGTTSTSAYYQNVTIGKGVNTTSTWKTITDANTNQNYETTYQAENSLVIPV